MAKIINYFVFSLFSLLGLLIPKSHADALCVNLFDPLQLTTKAQILTQKYSAADYRREYDRIRFESIDSQIAPLPNPELFEFALLLTLPTRTKNPVAYTYRFKIFQSYSDTPSVSKGQLILDKSSNPFEIFPTQIDLEVIRREHSLTKSSFQFLFANTKFAPDQIEVKPFVIEVDWSQKIYQLHIENFELSDLQIQLIDFKIEDLLANRHWAQETMLQKKFFQHMERSYGRIPPLYFRLLPLINNLRATWEYKGYSMLEEIDQLFSLNDRLKNYFAQNYFQLFVFPKSSATEQPDINNFKLIEGEISLVSKDQRGPFIELNDGYSEKPYRVYRDELFIALSIAKSEIPVQVSQNSLEEFHRLRDEKIPLGISRSHEPNESESLNVAIIEDININPISKKIRLSFKNLNGSEQWEQEIPSKSPFRIYPLPDLWSEADHQFHTLH